MVAIATVSSFRAARHGRGPTVDLPRKQTVNASAALVETARRGLAEGGQAVERLLSHGRPQVMPWCLVSDGGSGLAGRGREGQSLDQVQDLTRQAGHDPGGTGDQLPGRGEDDLRPALPDGRDDLARGAFGVHRDQRQAGAEGEPRELLPVLGGEAGAAVL